MNHTEAKQILLLYRPGTNDADDPEIAEALALAKGEPELASWLVEHCARQSALREKFQQIRVPAGLKEQITSEQAARERMKYWRPRMVLAAVASVVLLGWLATFWFPHRPSDDTLAIYQKRMVGVALRGYAMDLATNNPEAVRAHLAKHHAPADFILPMALKGVTLTGCAVESWQGEKVSMICFRTGKMRVPGGLSDLWLFVVDQASVKEVPVGDSPQFAKVNRLITATWTQGDKVYLLGTAGDEKTIRQYL